MIYTVISDINNFKSARESAQKRDCHNQWQPLTLIPRDVISYIENGKNDEVRLERYTAYSTLFFALFELYGKKDLTLCRTDSGKPYLIENGNASKIQIAFLSSPSPCCLMKVFYHYITVCTIVQEVFECGGSVKRIFLQGAIFLLISYSVCAVFG